MPLALFEVEEINDESDAGAGLLTITSACISPSYISAPA